MRFFVDPRTLLCAIYKCNPLIGQPCMVQEGSISEPRATPAHASTGAFPEALAAAACSVGLAAALRQQSAGQARAQPWGTYPACFPHASPGISGLSVLNKEMAAELSVLKDWIFRAC